MTDKDVKYIEIVFENCESICIPKERFNFLCIRKMSQRLIHQSHLPLNTESSFDNECGFLRMIISYEEDDELNYDSDECDEPLGMFLDNPTSNSVEDRPHVLGRILDFNDITHIDLMNAEKESLLYVSVPFRDDSFPDSNDLMAVNIRELPVYGKSIDIIIGEE